MDVFTFDVATTSSRIYGLVSVGKALHLLVGTSLTAGWDEAVLTPGKVQSLCSSVSCHQHQQRLKETLVAKAVGVCRRSVGC